MRPRALLLLLIGLLPLLNAPPQAQPAPARPVDDTTARADSLWQLDMEQVVVTATRAERSADDVGVPVSVIGQQEIEAQGAARATDLLADQPGLSINNDHGSGLQMRGLGPEYTLILLDGEPIVGRTAGTLDLGRLTTANIERVEVVRGPTSSLYGSEALAGVVNFITGAPPLPRRRTRAGGVDSPTPPPPPPPPGLDGRAAGGGEGTGVGPPRRRGRRHRGQTGRVG